MGGNRPPSLADRIVRAGDDGRLRAEEMVLPQSWALALSFLRDLSDDERYGRISYELSQGKGMTIVRLPRP